MYLKYHKARLTPTTPVTSIAISPVKMSIGRKSLTNLRSEMIFLQGKPVFFILTKMIKNNSPRQPLIQIKPNMRLTLLGFGWFRSITVPSTTGACVE
jgi:hypothetical protein